MNRLRHHFANAAQQQKRAYRRCYIGKGAPLPLSLHLSLHQNLDALVRLGVALVAVNLGIFAQQSPSVSAENPLEIVAAGVESSEDAPFVASDYRFLPGDYVYFQFQVAGYKEKTNENNEVRKMSLSYEIIPQDDKGVALTPAVSGTIQEDLGNEDKNWAPKRRASFLLPSFLAAGEFHLHVRVTDLIGNQSTQRDIPFHIGGTVVAPTTGVAVQDFQFLRKEDDNDPLDVPAYAPGDTVYLRFTITGFHLGAENQYHLRYGLTVNRPDGKVYLSQPSAAELKDRSFYPVMFIPGNLNVTTSRTAPRGLYVLLLTVHDLAGSQKYELKRTFTIE
jgi:hypothetical protein